MRRKRNTIPVADATNHELEIELLQRSIIRTEKQIADQQAALANLHVKLANQTRELLKQQKGN